MLLVCNMTARTLCLPAARISVSHLHQPHIYRRYSDRAPPSQPSSLFPSPSRSRSRSRSRSPSPSPPPPSSTSSESSAAQNNLLAPVNISENPNAVLKENHPAAVILANSGLVVRKELNTIRMLSQTGDQFVILDPHGNHVGFIVEQAQRPLSRMRDLLYRKREVFTAYVFDKQMKEVLRFHRPFSWHSGQTRIYDPIEHASPHPSSIPSAANESEPSARTSTVPLSNMRIIGETNTEWATLHRKYNLFLFHMPTGETNAPISTAALDLSAAQHALVGAQASDTDPGQYVQFAYIDSHPRLHEFALRSSSHQLIGHIDHTRSGFLRDLLNAGSYTLSMDAAESRAGASQSSRANMAYQRVVGGQKGEMGLTLDQRAVMLATAVAIDNDYYSPYSSRDDSLTLAGGEDFKAKAAPKKALKAEDTTGRVLGEPAKHQPDRALDPLLLAYAFAPPTSEIKSRQLPPPMDGTSSQDPWGQWPTGPDGWGGQPERAGTSEPVWDQNGKDPWSGQASQTGGDGKVRPGSSGVGEGGAAPEVPDGFFDLL